MSQQIQQVDFATSIANEIAEVTGAKTTVINQRTIQIDNDGIISSVRVRDARSGSSVDMKITHGGKSIHEDVGAKIVGDAWTNKDGEVIVDIKEKVIKSITSESTEWDINNISQGHVDAHNHERIHTHPSMGWAGQHNANGEVGISVEIRTPNAEKWEEMKKENDTKSTIPSGKTVFKIVSESDVDFDIDNDDFSIKGTIEQVDKVIARITGNPLVDW